VKKMGKAERTAARGDLPESQLADTEKKLREAMQRLLANKPRRTNGELTVVNLAREAGVGRATVYRVEGLVEEFLQARDRLIEEDAERHPAARADRLAKTLAEERTASRERIRELEEQVETMAQQVNALSLLLQRERTRGTSGQLTGAGHMGNSRSVIIPLGGRSAT
jgi:uncharacterized protein HemX